MSNIGRLGISAVIAIAVVAAYVSSAAAVQFTWSQHGGFELGTGALRAGQFFGADVPPVGGHGGLEYFGPQAPPAPANTYQVIGWGCPLDGNNDGNVNAASCANGGVAAEAVTGTNPATTSDRSSLILNVFNSAQSGVVDSQTGNEVVISRITHINNVIDNEANALRTVSVSSLLIVDSIPPLNDPNTIPIGFLETINIGECSQTPNPLGSQCDDEFTFDASQFNDVPFTHLGQTLFLQFGLRPVEECSQLVDTIGTIQIFQCTDDPNHRIAIDFDNGRAWAMEGFDNALNVVMRVTEQRVSAPNTVMLVALGMAGWTLMAWRRRSTS